MLLVAFGATFGGRTKATYCKNKKCMETLDAFRVYIVLFGVKIGDIEISADYNRGFDPTKCDIRLN